jgi:cytochrome c oxidase cbb3-type subunit 3/ubiquinol-cytochrome c reductase cytochrome c subunit
VLSPTLALRVRSFLGAAAVTLLAVLSGDLECRSPAPSDAERRGQALYSRMCSVCHGREGQGYAADRATALAQPDFLASVTDAFLSSAIADGRGATTMSAWSRQRGGPLGPADVDALVVFLRTRGSGDRVALDERPPTGDATRGADLYTHHCLSCHGAQGATGPYVHIGNPELLATASNGFLRKAIGDGRRGTPMPAFERTMGPSGIEDVLAALRSWQSSVRARPSPPRAAPIPLAPLPVHPSGPDPVGFRPSPNPTGVDVVHEQFERGARMALLDARAPSDYMNEHIAGAASVPFYDPDPYFADLPKDAWLVCYCACPHAESGQLAQKLVAKGFTRVTVLDEGFNVWKARHYPTRSGADP